MSDHIKVVCPGCSAANRVVPTRLADGARCGACKGPLFAGQPLELTAATFDRHVSHNGVPVIVDFWAAWCAPCKMMAPAYAQAARQLEPQVRLAKLDTEGAPQIAARYSIRSIPTLVAFKDGMEVARQASALDVAGVVQWVRANV